MAVAGVHLILSRKVYHNSWFSVPHLFSSPFIMPFFLLLGISNGVRQIEDADFVHDRSEIAIRSIYREFDKDAQYIIHTYCSYCLYNMQPNIT
jgi:hypothetical protein